MRSTTDSGGIELLLRAVERLQAESAADLMPEVALARLGALMTAREQLAAVALDAVRDADVRELYALAGAGSIRGWLRAQPCGDDGQLSLARRLAQRTHVAGALSTGSIGVRAAGALCTALDKVPATVDDELVVAVLVDGVGHILRAAQGGRPDRLLSPAELAERQADAALLDTAAGQVTASPVDRLEPGLLLLARRLTPNLLGHALRQLTDALQPDGTDKPAADPYYVELRPVQDGDWDLRGLLDPATGAALLDQLTRRQTDTPAQQAAREKVHLRLVAIMGACPPTGEASADSASSLDRAGTDPAGPDPAGPDPAGPSPAGPSPAGPRSTSPGVFLPSVRRPGVRPAVPLAPVPDLLGDGRPLSDLELFDACLAEAQHPDHPTRAGTLTPAGRLRHDALATILDDAAGTEVGTTNPAPAGLSITCTLPALLGQAGALPGQLHRPGLPPVTLPTATLQRLGCDSILSAVLTDAAGHPIGASGTHRHANRRERRALSAQWGASCATLGCHNTRTVPHHAIPWWLSHHTRLGDLVPLCEHCHHDLHEGHRTLRLRDGRWINDTGWAQHARSA